MNIIDIQDLRDHLPDSRIVSDDTGGVSLLHADQPLVLGVAQHATDPSAAILGLAVTRDGRVVREVFVLASDWSDALPQVAHVVQHGVRRYHWIGRAQARHQELVRELESAREMAAVCACRRSGAEIVDLEDQVTAVIEGEGRVQAALQISAQPGHEVKLRASLGRNVLFELAATVSEAPARAVEAWRALTSGERLRDSEALTAQRAAQAAFVEASGLASYPGSIWRAADSHRFYQPPPAPTPEAEVPSPAFDALVARLGAARAT